MTLNTMPSTGQLAGRRILGELDQRAAVGFCFYAADAVPAGAQLVMAICAPNC